MTISPDGRTIATLDAGGVVRLFDTLTWQAQTTTYTPGVADVTAIALSPDGRTTALAGKGVVIWDRIDQKPRVTLHAKDACTSVSFSADGHSLAVATTDGATIWDTAIWQKQMTLAAAGGAGTVRFWPARSALAVAAGGHTIRVYDLSTRQVVTTLNSGDIADFALSVDGRTIAAAGTTGVTVWDSRTGVARRLP
jgi:dipeptidyl aminopeptidase/acylaminoacyl peptidase